MNTLDQDFLPYKNLANAVVLKAVQDYLDIPKDRKSIKNFFSSQEFELFSDLNGKRLLELLNDKIEKGEGRYIQNAIA